MIAGRTLISILFQNLIFRQQRKRQHAIRYHILKRKYVAHPNDIKIDPYVKNHMQFLYKNYRSMDIELFTLKIEN
jgi:hypothetical protein